MTFVIAHLVLTGVLAALLLLVITVQSGVRLLRRMWPATWDGSERRTGAGVAWSGVDRRQPAFG